MSRTKWRQVAQVTGLGLGAGLAAGITVFEFVGDEVVLLPEVADAVEHPVAGAGVAGHVEELSAVGEVGFAWARVAEVEDGEAVFAAESVEDAVEDVVHRVVSFWKV